MGRHARRGTTEKADTGVVPVVPQDRSAPPPASAATTGSGPGLRRPPSAAPGAEAAGRERGTRPAPTATDAPRPHPEHREQGGAWGDFGPGVSVAPPASRTDPQSRMPGPRWDYVAAFDDLDTTGGTGNRVDAGLDADDDVFAAGALPKGPSVPYRDITGRDDEPEDEEPHATAERPDDERAGGSRGRTFTGIAAAAVTTVLAVVVAGQVADGRAGDARAAVGAGTGAASRSAERPPPAEPKTEPSPVPKPETYEQKMGKKYPLATDLKASGEFEVIGGLDKSPGRGQKFRYRVDVEKGLGLDGELFAQAVQKTLNDERSWAHGGGRTFERVSSGRTDFVITLASPGTTAVWCAKSGLDTTEDNVSCDSAATERVMINAYRWAQGAKTYGDAIHAYRQMLINHEIGHRLGFDHVLCSVNGALAPVMQQQTKFLESDGIKCRPNPWAFPGN